MESVVEKKDREATVEGTRYAPPTLERFGSIAEITKVDMPGPPDDGFSSNMNPSGT